jgi:hypothetical protein
MIEIDPDAWLASVNPFTADRPKPPAQRRCAGGREPIFTGPKRNWYELYPGFWIPNTWPVNRARWLDYTRPDYLRILEDAPDPEALLRLGSLTRIERRWWGVWIGSFGCDRPLTPFHPTLHEIADRRYENARYVYLVPAWRRRIIELLTEIDDIEDQVSTILWVVEWITRRFIPIPPGVLNGADALRRSLDTAERALAGITPFRSFKPAYLEELRRAKRAKDNAKRSKNALLAWFSANWGRLLEALQATGTWFDVGIVLGPIFGFIEEGLWGLARYTMNNYLIAADALAPGYREDFLRNAEDLYNRVQNAWNTTWERIMRWDNAALEDLGLIAP